jgi:phytoene desaturase
MKNVLIIGAGMGGLATALRLRHRGYEVKVLEQNPRPGGRCNVLEESGFRIDTGPTILVMKDMFEETYRALDLDIDERIEFTQLDPNYRIYYHDDSYMDLYSNMARLAEEVRRIEPGSVEMLFRFIGDSAKKYQLAMEFVERNYDHITDLANPRAGYRLVLTSAYQRLYNQVSKYFTTDKLRKAFSFHSMFLGLSPFEALAMYSLITYADMAKGMHYPSGGIYSIIEDMVSLAHSMGIEIETDCAVKSIVVENGKASGVELENGERLDADLVVSNADLPYTYTQLIDSEHRKKYTDDRLERMSYACSGYILFLGTNKTYPHMRHQSIYFADDYKANLDSIFITRTVPADPSFHLSNPTITDPSVAPEGHSILYLLAPMPNLQGDINWDEAVPPLRERLLDRLEKIVDPHLREQIVWDREYRPEDWLHDVNAVHGTAFGSFSHGFFQSAYFRPHNKARDIEGLYFVGQGTYPGIGMPMVLLSARLVTERIEKEVAK